MPLTAARHVQLHYQLQITSKTNQNSSHTGPKTWRQSCSTETSQILVCRKARHQGQTLWKIALQNRVNREHTGNKLFLHERWFSISLSCCFFTTPKGYDALRHKNVSSTTDRCTTAPATAVAARCPSAFLAPDSTNQDTRCMAPGQVPEYMSARLAHRSSSSTSTSKSRSCC